MVRRGEKKEREGEREERREDRTEGDESSARTLLQFGLLEAENIRFFVEEEGAESVDGGISFFNKTP